MKLAYTCVSVGGVVCHGVWVCLCVCAYMSICLSGCVCITMCVGGTECVCVRLCERVLACLCVLWFFLN